MMWLKACIRCQGDLVEGFDFDGPVVQCLQCGRSVASPRQPRSRMPAAPRRRSTPRGLTAGDLGPMMASHQAAPDAWAS